MAESLLTAPPGNRVRTKLIWEITHHFLLIKQTHIQRRCELENIHSRLVSQTENTAVLSAVACKNTLFPSHM